MAFEFYWHKQDKRQDSMIPNQAERIQHTHDQAWLDKQRLHRHPGSGGAFAFSFILRSLPLILTASSPWFPTRNVLHHSNYGGWQYQQ